MLSVSFRNRPRVPWHRAGSGAFATFLLLGMCAPAPRAQVAAVRSDEVVSLPPFVVEGKNHPLQWRYLAQPGMELLSACDDEVALDLVRRMHRLDELLTVLLPDRFRATTTVPETQILFNEEVSRSQSREIIDEMLTRRAGGAGPASEADAAARRSAAFGPNSRVRFLPNMRLWDLDATAVFSILTPSTRAEDSTYAVDRIAVLLDRRVPALPDWFVEGTLGLYAQTELRTNDLAIAPLRWLNEEESKAIAREPEWPRPLFSMAEMFNRWRPQAAGEPSELDRVWRAQCALFVRWAVVEEKGARREALWKFVDRLETEPLSETLFREHFGMGFSDMRDRLSDYLPRAVAQRVTLEGPKTKPLPRLRFRPATDLEIARLRGCWERMQIAYVRRQYPHLVARYVEQARQTLRRAYERGQYDSMLLAELGLTEIDAGEPDAARDFLAAAERAGAARPRAAFELARLRLHAASDPAAPAAKLTSLQVEQILQPLRAARGQHPPLVESYTLAGDTWFRSPTPPSGADLDFLDEGARLFPRFAPVVIRAIHFHGLAGNRERALALIDLGQRHAREASVHERFERLRQQMRAAQK